MRVDVAHARGRFDDACVRCIFKRAAHGQGCAFCPGLGDVVGVGGHAEADNLRVDARPAGQRRLERLEDHHCGAFAEGHAVAVHREGAAGGGRNHAHRVPRAQKSVGERGLIAAGDGGGSHA